MSADLTPSAVRAYLEQSERATEGPWRYNPLKCYRPGVAGAKPVVTDQEGVFSPTPDGSPTIALTGESRRRRGYSAPSRPEPSTNSPRVATATGRATVPSCSSGAPMTYEELLTTLAENPALALRVVPDVMIAGPRRRGGDGTIGGPVSSRTTLGGETIALVDFGVFADSAKSGATPDGGIWSDRGESADAFTARVDEAWRAAGWILVDEVTK